jgi:CRP-like cAMP-binding protein
MEQFFEILSRCPLFSGLTAEEIGAALDTLGARTVTVAKGEPVFLEGEPAHSVGIVLTGTVQVVRDDYNGGQSMLTAVPTGGMFAEVFACAGVTVMPVSVVAPQPATVLLLDCARLLHEERLAANLLRTMAQKNLALTEKIRFMSQKTTRDKLMEYLLAQAKLHGSSSFTIPYNRQGLANYLGVERSAMSAEIGRLRQDGVIESRGSWFSLKKMA